MITLSKRYQIDDHGTLWEDGRPVKEIDRGLRWRSRPGHDAVSLTGAKITYHTFDGQTVRRFEEQDGRVWWCPASATIHEVRRAFSELDKIKRESPGLFARSPAPATPASARPSRADAADEGVARG